MTSRAGVVDKGLRPMARLPGTVIPIESLRIRPGRIANGNMQVTFGMEKVNCDEVHIIISILCCNLSKKTSGVFCQELLL